MFVRSRWLCVAALALGCSGNQTFDDGSDDVSRRQHSGPSIAQATTDSGSEGVCRLPPYVGDVVDRPGSPPYAECTGCHPSLFFLGDQEGDVPDCSVPEEVRTERGEALGFSAAALPCGACTDEGYRCEIGIQPSCDFDGDGPEPHEQNPEYADNWLCECASGVWDCWIWAASGASCQPPLPNE